MAPVFFKRKFRAAWLIRNPCSAASATMRSLVAVAISVLPASDRETVATETPASFASSTKVEADRFSMRDACHDHGKPPIAVQGHPARPAFTANYPQGADHVFPIRHGAGSKRITWPHPAVKQSLSPKRLLRPFCTAQPHEPSLALAAFLLHCAGEASASAGSAAS